MHNIFVEYIYYICGQIRDEGRGGDRQYTEQLPGQGFVSLQLFSAAKVARILQRTT